MRVLPAVFSIGLNLNKKKLERSVPREIYSPPAPIFSIYKGPRWSLPPNIKISQSIHYKFNSLVTIFDYKQIREEISKKVSMIGFYFPGCAFDTSSAYVINERREWMKVKSIYSKLFRFRKNLLALIFRWQIRKCYKNIKNTEDPVTLEIPKKPVYVLDFVNRASFVYDASTLKRTIQDRILLSDHMFPMPKRPVNLLTNKEFTYGQLYSIIQQCKKHGETSWILESLIDLSCYFNRFVIHNKQTLKLKAISSFFDTLPLYLIKETLIDYFTYEADSVSLNENIITSFIDYIDTESNLPVVKRWIYLTKQYYIATELQDSTLLRDLGLHINTFFSRLRNFFMKQTSEPRDLLYIFVI
jgi:hypothetical protein